ncbi:isovaleryl-CoA dehydrogenase [Ramlibacter sp. RBP-2]|uniref:Isovaleryl-CoA dehydrogenase n=1 Tax=Ramlibacter lithotrophicus TaxID=2606681 RepID=A0A7X6DKU0_9BURK|nr:acyl-CoA dehydrogenase family protein [Ramlibacter lithotrophicus]NKE68838.1 isovaleryl-CoA dehydrogenase [Ramlibacter lithotrophicus]
MHIELDEDTERLREAVRRFANERVAPIAAEVDAENRFPRELWPAFGELGLLGITVAEVDGGTGLGYLQHVVALEEITRASASIGMSYGAHSNLVLNQLRKNANSELKRRYLPKLLSGEHVASLAMSEPGAGSDVVGMRLRAERKGDRYILNGTKLWITNGIAADVYLVYAKTAPEAGKNGISAMVVQRDFPGFCVGQKLDTFGMRGSGTAELTFEDCEVPVENLVGGENAGVQVMMSGLDFERIVVSASPLGIMQAALDLSLPYLNERRQFGQPIGNFQLMQGKLADIYAALGACRAQVYAVAAAADRGRVTRKDAAALILFVAERATEAALQAMQCLGGNGYSNEYPAARLVRDAKLYEIGAGTSEIRRMLVGRELLAGR